MNPLIIAPAVLAGITLCIAFFLLTSFLFQRTILKNFPLFLFCLAVAAEQLCCANLYAASDTSEQWQLAYFFLLGMIGLLGIIFAAQDLHLRSSIFFYVGGGSFLLLLGAMLVLPRDWILTDQPIAFEPQLSYTALMPGPLGVLTLALYAGLTSTLLLKILRDRIPLSRLVKTIVVLALTFFLFTILNDTAVNRGLYAFYHLLEYGLTGIVLLASYSRFYNLLQAVTTSKKQEQQERQLRNILDNAPSIIYVKDTNGKYILVNRKFETTFKVQREQILGKKDDALFSPDLASQFQRDDSQVLRSRKATQFDGATPKNLGGGEYVWAKFPLLNPTNEPYAICGIAMDITKRQQIENALRQSEERYRNILETIREGYFEINLDGLFLFFNDPMCALFKTPREQLEKMNIDEFCTESNRVSAFFSRIAGKKTLGTAALEFVQAENKTIMVEISASPILDKKNEVIGLRGLARDVSKQQEVDRDREHLFEQLRHAEKMEAVGTLAGGTAHDFNNLLMGIQGYVSLLLLDLDSTHPHYEPLKEIEQQVQQGAKLSDQLLGFARGGKYDVLPLDINQLLRESSDMFGRTHKEITIIRQFCETIWTMEGDRGQIEQVLLNLYLNAWHAMPDGGEMRLQSRNIVLSGKESARIGLDPGQYIQLSISDEGIGMDAETRKHIFEPFFTTRKLGRGSGLGLASAYGIVTNHGGHIQVESEEDKGTVFHLYFPATSLSPLEQRTPTGELIRGHGTILLADDEEIIRRVGARLLRRMGYETLIADCGQKAIELYAAEKRRIDLVILDMIMPGMNGREVYRRLRDLSPNVKVLLASGYSLDEQATEIMREGCRGFIQKPFSIQRLSSKIEEIIKNDKPRTACLNRHFPSV